MRKISYLTDNVIIVSQGTGMGGGDTGSVAKFPYIWMRALGNGGEGEVVIVELRWGPEFARRTEEGRGKCKSSHCCQIPAVMLQCRDQIHHE